MRSNTSDVEEGKGTENLEEETDGKLVFNHIRLALGVMEMLRTIIVLFFVRIPVVLLAIEVSLLDPLFFYIPAINEWQKCVRLDKKLGISVMVFRSLVDSFYVNYIIAQLHKYCSVARSRFP
ncbi:putative cyclic nucleotide-gated ion channel 8 [Tripterygium wilfordii]|uniref:putative cyclic nucleotide-gated ion channel 8 n=1 Tax=Tripterygium wilfordii TaxID=458696 RepID=UPI0018F824BF|nr:putative cyclic nucleotide-gated ion channel 8 [Tripterygium wilfordii]